MAPVARTEHLTPPAAVLFDLDGTLVDSERENVESVVLACRALGAELTDEERRFVVGHSWNEIHARLSAHHGLRLSMEALIARAVDEKRALLAQGGHRPLPAAVATVRRLAAAGVPLAIASGASRVEVRDAIVGIGSRSTFRSRSVRRTMRGENPSPIPTSSRWIASPSARTRAAVS